MTVMKGWMIVYTELQDLLIKRYSIKFCDGKYAGTNHRCANSNQRTHVCNDRRKHKIRNWDRQDTLDSTVTLLHEIGHFENIDQKVPYYGRAEDEYYATWWMIDECKRLGFDPSHSIVLAYQMYIWEVYDDHCHGYHDRMKKRDFYNVLEHYRDLYERPKNRSGRPEKKMPEYQQLSDGRCVSSKELAELIKAKEYFTIPEIARRVSDEIIERGYIKKGISTDGMAELLEEKLYQYAKAECSRMDSMNSFCWPELADRGHYQEWNCTLIGFELTECADAEYLKARKSGFISEHMYYCAYENLD